MSTPPKDGSGARRADSIGAVRAKPKRKLGLLWLLLGLLALLLLGLLLYLLLRGGGTKTAVVAPVSPVATTATDQPPAPPVTVPDSADVPTPNSAALTPTIAVVAPATAGVSPAADPTTPTPAPLATPSPATQATSATTATPATTGTQVTPVSPPDNGPFPNPSPGGLVGGGTVEAKPATGAAAGRQQDGEVLFAEGSAVVTPQGQRVITEAAALIRAEHPGTVTVTGYTDKVAGQPVNGPLSQQRADNVLTALKKAVGDSVKVIYAAIAKGESDPVATNGTAEGRQANRRATITTS